MPIPQIYFELRDIQTFQRQSWIPLRQIVETSFEPTGADVVSLGEWIGTGTAAIENTHREVAEQLGWTGDLDVSPHRAVVERWGYSATDVFRSGSRSLGINLVIDQHVEQEDQSVWHLHPDIIVALGLVREGDSWYRPEEGWAEVARIKRDGTESPTLFEMKAEFLRDYLAAREMTLYCSSYRERIAITATKPAYGWEDDQFKEAIGRHTRECIIVDAEYPDPEGHFWIRGALWRTEWVEAGSLSTRVRGDSDPHTITFALENDGTRAAADQLMGAMSWLYFEPTVVSALLRHRSAKLRWATAETGSLGATANGVHFGVNILGLITVFAKDIGRLQPWEQRLWSAHNVTPDGGVSRELFAAQMEVNPAATVAPEKQLLGALTDLDAAFTRRHGSPLLREHVTVPLLAGRAHRFAAAEADGLLDLAKELTRIFIERIEVDAIIKAIALPKADKKPSSLKALEKLVANYRSHAEASAMMAPLFGIYDLRLADAHLGLGRVASGLNRAGVDGTLPAAMQGRQLIQAFVDTLHKIRDAMN